MTIARVPELEDACRALGVYVAAFETFAEFDPADLVGVERDQIEGMGPNRLSEFVGGRVCAHAALESSGFARQALLKSADRIPAWPDGATGSISHSHGYCVAVAGRFAGHHVGIDAEAIGRVGEKLWSRLFTDAEQAYLRSLPPGEAIPASTVMFSVKEAFYKAQFPLTRAWVSFRDVHVDHDPARSDLVLRPATDLAALDQVQWPVKGTSMRRRNDLILTAVTVDTAPG